MVRLVLKFVLFLFLSSFIADNSSLLFCEDPETRTNCTYVSKAMESSTSTDVFLAFWHLFIWFWSSGFVNAIGTMTVAGTVGKWYFQKKGDNVTIMNINNIIRMKLVLLLFFKLFFVSVVTILVLLLSAPS